MQYFVVVLCFALMLRRKKNSDQKLDGPTKRFSFGYDMPSGVTHSPQRYQPFIQICATFQPEVSASRSQSAGQQDHNSEARNTHRNQKDTPLTPLSNFDDILQKEPSTIQPTAGYASAHVCNLHTKQRLPKEVGVFEAESVFVEIEL